MYTERQNRGIRRAYIHSTYLSNKFTTTKNLIVWWVFCRVSTVVKIIPAFAWDTSGVVLIAIKVYVETARLATLVLHTICNWVTVTSYIGRPPISGTRWMTLGTVYGWIILACVCHSTQFHENGWTSHEWAIYFGKPVLNSRRPSNFCGGCVFQKSRGRQTARSRVLFCAEHSSFPS